MRATEWGRRRKEGKKLYTEEGRRPELIIPPRLFMKSIFHGQEVLLFIINSFITSRPWREQPFDPHQRTIKITSTQKNIGGKKITLLMVAVVVKVSEFTTPQMVQTSQHCTTILLTSFFPVESKALATIVNSKKRN